MDLVWKVRRITGPSQTVRWSDGKLVTPVLQIERAVNLLVERRVAVNCGEVGPELEASLERMVSAWGTISEAIRQTAWMAVMSPPPPVVEADFTSVQSPESGV